MINKLSSLTFEPNSSEASVLNVLLSSWQPNHIFSVWLAPIFIAACLPFLVLYLVRKRFRVSTRDYLVGTIAICALALMLRPLVFHIGLGPDYWTYFDWLTIGIDWESFIFTLVVSSFVALLVLFFGKTHSRR